MHWFLDNWNLITLDSKRNAKVLPACDNNNNNNNKKFPLIVFSHGLGGTGGLYSYQTRSLAAQGYVVVALDHTDGSAPVVQKLDGTILTLDNEANELWNSQNPLESVLVRRRQTEWRAMELEATALALKGLNQKNIPELESLGISFVDRLDVSRLVAMGHSFGGATALTLGFRRPDLIHAVIAHEPAIDWTPNDIRRLVFPKEAVVEYEPPYNGGTGGFGTDERVSTTNVTTYQDMPVLVLSSQEWWDRDGMGMCHLFSHMHKVGSMGQYGNFAVIRDAFHNEFSDMCLLTPLWLARALQVTGSRDPKETAQEIVHRSLAFLESIKGHTPTIIKTGPTITSDHDEL
jgi:platelet-activating factor acetylhydrolase